MRQVECTCVFSMVMCVRAELNFIPSSHSQLSTDIVKKLLFEDSHGVLLMANAEVVVVDHDMNQSNHPMVITEACGIFHFALMW